MTSWSRRPLAGLLVLVLAASPVAAQEAPPPPTALSVAPSPETQELERRYQELLDNQRRLEERLERFEARDAERAARPFGLGPDGFFVGRRETFQIRLSAVLQADGRAFFDQTPPIADVFVIRRARPIVEATVGDLLELKIVPDFAGGTVQLFDAYIEFKPFTWLSLRGGKFKTPFGLERLEQDRYINFLERGLPSALAPDRDLGAVLFGSVADGSFQYTVGILNGTADGASVDTDTNDPKEYVARVFAHPLRFLHRRWLDKFGTGFAATYGKQKGSATATGLPAYKTAGQNTFFSYVSDSTGAKPNAIALGDRYRFTPQLYYYVGPFGLLAEYVYSATHVSTLGNPGQLIVNQAWQVEASWVVTGERNGYDGVRPRHPFSLARRHFGAVDVGARYGELRVDDAAFPTYADPTRSARAALAWGVMSNWYFNAEAKFGLLFERTTFTGGQGKGDRTPENALIGRLQFAF